MSAVVTSLSAAIAASSAASPSGVSSPTVASPSRRTRKLSLLSPDLSGTTTIVVFGASGDLAKKKTFPALFALFRSHLLPPKTQIVGYARTTLSRAEFHERVKGHIKLRKDSDDAETLVRFLDQCYYIHGSYNLDEDYKRLYKFMCEELEARVPAAIRHHIFYLALPPSVFVPAATGIRRNCYSATGHNRVVVEKPFGKDFDTSKELSNALAGLFPEEEIYRIDHYLGKEMVKNLLVLRFSNIFFGAIWNRNYVDTVQITFKETIGTEGRGGYFDQYGIIRDVMQNHLLQLLSIVAMERPVSLDAEDVRNEKVKVLRCIAPLEPSDVLLGQYTGSPDGSKQGYRDDATVPVGSHTPTYAIAHLRIHNDRWEGVPFILRCGKALNEAKAEIRIQFRQIPGLLFPEAARNELVIRVQPREAVYVKMMNKKPGLGSDLIISELDLSYDRRYASSVIPDAYESLILDCIQGEHSNFVRVDELDAAWKIFTPLLHKIDSIKGADDACRQGLVVNPYVYGSRGPEGAASFIERCGYVRHAMDYNWNQEMRGQGKL